MPSRICLHVHKNHGKVFELKNNLICFDIPGLPFPSEARPRAFCASPIVVNDC